MTPAQHIREEIEKIGYSAIRSDYVFSGVFSDCGVSRTATIAAFTQTPPSYRNAALAVVHAQGRRPIDIVSEYRALGAPLLFVIEGRDVTVWQVRPETGPVPITSATQ